jgi:hypothetical protein
MSWFLIFWLGSPTNYQPHSNYESKAECQKNAVYYLTVFDKVNTKLMADCVSYTYVKHQPKNDQLVIRKYEFK